MKAVESVLDQPQNDLCKEVWKKDKDGNYSLRPEAHQKISNIVNWIIEKFDLDNPSVNITGSITSNSYSKDSDIDVHIYSPSIPQDKADNYNKQLRIAYEETFKDSFSETDKIGSHPIEVYFQVNQLQDMMSVGCYDFLNKKWIVGPDFENIQFDPYSEYFDDDMAYVDGILTDMRNTIFEIYELCIVYKNSKDIAFKGEVASKILMKMKEAADLFDNMRKMRTAYSTPISKEDALQKRSSRKWKIADSSFKMMDKFGYLPIMKMFKTELQNIKENPKVFTQTIENIISRFDLKGEFEKSGIAGIVKENDIEFNKTLGTKILFLDYDGVICPLTKETRGDNYRPDNNIVLNIKKVCQETGAKIVWSTSWKNYNNNAVRTFRRIEYKSPMPELNRIFASYLFEIPETDNLINEFPDNPGMSKYTEILKFLKDNKDKISDFIVIDDQDYMAGGLSQFGQKFILTDPKRGISDWVVNQILNRFSSPF